MDDNQKIRPPSARPRRKPAVEAASKPWKEELFSGGLPPAAQPEPEAEPEIKPVSREDLPSTVQAGEIIEDDGGEIEDTDAQPRKRGYRELLEWVLVFAGAALVVILLLRFVAEPIHVDGYSMQDTLAPDEYVLVSKYDYLTKEAVRRFDVVSCKYPTSNKAFVKRVIGLPGETVELAGGELYINGQQMEQDFPLRKDTADYGPVTVPKDHYIVMGDNRANSTDSRDPSVGPLPRNKIEGHVRRVIFPLSEMRAMEDKHRAPLPVTSRLPAEEASN